MWMGIAQAEEIVFVASPDGGAFGGRRLVAEAKCPGRGCKNKLRLQQAPVIDHLLRVAGRRANAEKIGEGACPACGQRFEAWPAQVVKAVIGSRT